MWTPLPQFPSKEGWYCVTVKVEILRAIFPMPAEYRYVETTRYFNGNEFEDKYDEVLAWKELRPYIPV